MSEQKIVKLIQVALVLFAISLICSGISIFLVLES